MNIYDSWLVKSPIAHRGLWNETIPENSIAAFKNAIKHKLPIQFEVTYLTDGTTVVFHDERLARMTGKDGYISSCSYHDISKLNLAGTKEKIPTLKEVLELVDGKVPLLIEIKNWGKVGDVEKAVWKALQGYNGEYTIISFNPYTLEWFKNNDPQVKRGQISSFFKDKEITGIKKFSLKRMLLNKKISEPNFIAYSASDMPNRFVKKYFGKIPVIAYTIKNEEEEKRVLNFADNIIFDTYTPSSLKEKK
ncbi:MAG: glycerophosphodiester phosphodiesterase [Clostridia bacterium]|nr:glycerophosphodiester phosphodiesterase [Clostridia bacterium]